ncbi:MAG: cobalamin B12-binding domain-containing protein [Acidimicrobiia bacterium]|nr:cobalamin B12-binding domain-containing protein [Acidimicrobiia bacterium]
MSPSGSEPRPPATAGVDLRRKRILIAKPGLDGHDVGAKVIALALRDAGADVIYTGLRRSADYIARVAVDEGVDAVGLSILSGSHVDLVAQTREALRAAEADDVVLFVGGTIPAQDHEPLRALGVADVFTAEDRLDDVVRRVARHLVAERL